MMANALKATGLLLAALLSVATVVAQEAGGTPDETDARQIIVEAGEALEEAGEALGERIDALVQTSLQQMPAETIRAERSDAAQTGIAGADIRPLARPDASSEVVHWAWLPSLSDPAITWIGVALILALMLQPARLSIWRSLDALVLALMALLLPLRFFTGPMGDVSGAMSVQSWSYILLSVGALYWVIRGVSVAFGRGLAPVERNMSDVALTVLVVAGVALAALHIWTAPLSAGSIDGLAGGAHTAVTGMTPYGDVDGHDARSPLLYYAHAGFLRLNAQEWCDEAGVATVARLVNTSLFLLMAFALALIGRQNHSSSLGLTLVALFCFFPGAAESLTRPEVMLPATLGAWSLAFVRVPGVGGFLAALTLVVTGLAWPWAWLGLPLLLAYFFRRGWQAFTATVGALAGVAGILVGVTLLTPPTPPRADGALAIAGLAPQYSATLSEGHVALAASQASAATSGLTAPLWRFLLERESAVVDGAPGDVFYRHVIADSAARPALRDAYRRQVADFDPATRMWVGLRSLLEAVWTPTVAREHTLPHAWQVWQTGADPQRWLTLRRIAKGAVGVFAIVLAWLLWRGERFDPAQLVGGMLAIATLALLASESGAIAGLAWLMPWILGLLAAHTVVVPPVRRPDPHILERMATKPPRVTVEP